MSPTTPITPLRLSAADRARLTSVAWQMGVSMTEAARIALRALGQFEVVAGLHEPAACHMGEGHTAHVWELWPSKGQEGGLRFCGGQPFSNGYDPIDEPAVQQRLKEYQFVSRGLQPCCGASNPPCDKKDPYMLAAGCDACGHPLGCHARN